MRVMGNISKKVMVAIMSASMAMTPAAGALALPMTVCATDPSNTIENNTEDLDEAFDVIIEENNASIYSLHTGGTVKNNNDTVFYINSGGTVETNNDLVKNINDGGTVETNNDTVRNINDGGTVENNCGTVENINDGGTVENNNSIVENINDGGTVETNEVTIEKVNVGGVVINNFGTVQTNEGTVTNNYGGEVTGGTVQNQFWKVFLEGDQRYSATYGTDFVNSSNQEDPHKYIQVTSNGAATGNSGTVTFASKSGYELSGNEQANQNGSNEGVTFTYTTVRNANGSYSITISSLNGNLYLTPESVQLVLSAISQPSDDESTPTPSNIVENDDGSITLTINSADANTASVASIAAVPDIASAAVKEGRTMFAVPNAKGVGTATVGTTKVTVSYHDCTVPYAIETFVAAPADEEATRMLEQFVVENFPGRKIAVKVKARLYKAGLSINEFGVLHQSYGIGYAYDGQNAEVVQIHKDGTITVTTVPMVNGKVSFAVTDMGTFFIAI